MNLSRSNTNARQYEKQSFGALSREKHIGPYEDKVCDFNWAI